MTESKQEDQQLPHAEEPIEMTGAQMIWAAFEREGVDVVFGHPGGAILPAYDALSPYEASGQNPSCACTPRAVPPATWPTGMRGRRARWASVS